MSEFTLNAFGPPAIRDATGNTVQFRTRKHLALLVYLTFESRRRGVTRDQLVDLFWPEVPLQRARHSLAQALTSLRGGLGAEALTRRAERVQLLVPIHLEEDTDDIIGQPLEDVERGLSVAFSHWVDGVRANLRRRVISNLRERLARARGDGSQDEIDALTDLLLLLHPNSIDAQLTLAERAVQSGLHSKAARLLEGLEVDNDPGFVKRVDIVKEELRSSVAPILKPRTSLSGSNRRFDEREDDDGWLNVRQLQLESERIGVRTCWIRGFEGTGSNIVVRRAIQTCTARSGFALQVRCYAFDSDVPFSTISRLICQICTDPNTGSVDPHWLSEASRVAPCVKGFFPGVPAPEPPGLTDLRLRLTEALFQIFDVVIGNAPCVIVVQDLQLIDAESADIIALLLRRAKHKPITFIAFTPNSEGGAHVKDFEWSLEVVSRHRPLGSSAAERLIVAEAMKNGDNRLTLQLLSVIGRPVPPDFLDRVLRSKHQSVGTTVGGLALRRLIKWSGDCIELEDSVKAQVDSLTTETVRLRLNRAVGFALKRSDKVQEVAHAATHLLQSDKPLDALELVARAAAKARDIGAYVSALDLIEKAIAYTDEAQFPTQLRVLYADLLNRSGNSHGALEWLEGLSSQERETVAVARIVAESSVAADAPRTESSASTSRYFELATKSGNTEDQIRALFLEAELAARHGDRARLGAIESAGRSLRASTQYSQSLLLGFCNLGAGQFRNAYEHFCEAACNADGIGEKLRPSNGCGNAAAAFGRLHQAIEHYEETFLLAVKVGDFAFASNVAANAGTCLVDGGSMRLAEAWFDRSLDANSNTIDNHYISGVLANLSDFYLVKGDLVSAETNARRAVVAANQRGSRRAVLEGIFAKADVRFAQGDTRGALRLLAGTVLADRRRGQALRQQIIFGFDSSHLARMLMVFAWLQRETCAIDDPLEWAKNEPISIPSLIELLFLRQWIATERGEDWTPSISAEALAGATQLWGTKQRIRRIGFLP